MRLFKRLDARFFPQWMLVRHLFYVLGRMKPWYYQMYLLRLPYQRPRLVWWRLW